MRTGSWHLLLVHIGPCSGARLPQSGIASWDYQQIPPLKLDNPNLVDLLSSISSFDNFNHIPRKEGVRCLLATWLLSEILFRAYSTLHLDLCRFRNLDQNARDHQHQRYVFAIYF